MNLDKHELTQVMRILNKRFADTVVSSFARQARNHIAREVTKLNEASNSRALQYQIHERPSDGRGPDSLW